MEQQAKIRLLKKLGLFLDVMTPDDRLVIYMDKDGKVKYESRIVEKGMV